jgi:RNA polymerase sigma-70 factor (ECF subfamily)
MPTFERELIAAIPELLRYAERRCASPHAAEDAVQDTLIRLLRNRDQYALRTNIAAWGKRDLKHAMIDHWRSEGLHRKRGEAWGNVVSPVAADDPHAVLEYSEALAAVRALPPDEATALCAVAAGYSHPEAVALAGKVEPNPKLASQWTNRAVTRGRSRIAEHAP